MIGAGSSALLMGEAKTAKIRKQVEKNPAESVAALELTYRGQRASMGLKP